MSIDRREFLRRLGIGAVGVAAVAAIPALVEADPVPEISPKIVKIPGRELYGCSGKEPFPFDEVARKLGEHYARQRDMEITRLYKSLKS